MADVKISQLPAATTPLDGTEVLPIVQSTTTKKVAVADLTAGRALSATSLTLTTTPLAVSSGGTGITSGTSGGVPYFSSTSTIVTSATLAANSLVVGGGPGAPPTTITTGTGVTTALGVNVGSAGSVVVNGGVLGTPSSGTLTNATGLPIVAGTTGTLTAARGGTGLTALGTGVATALGNATNAASGLVALDANQNATIGGTLAMGSSFLRNRIINGGMRIDQRNAGASQTITAAAALAYTVDRWYAYCTGANVTGQQVSSTGTTDSPAQNAYRFTGAASVTAIGFGQRIEAVNCFDFAGQTATLSVNLANSVLTTVTWTAFYANTTDTFGTLASPTVTQIATGTFTVNSTLTRYTTNISIPSAATTGIQIVFTVGAQTSGTWTIGNVQLERGSVATPFERRQYGQELALCQRYLYKPAIDSGTGNSWLVPNATWSSGTAGFSSGIFPVTMRVVPALSTETATLSNYAIYTASSGAYSNLTALTLNAVSTSTTFLLNYTTAAGGTAGQGGWLVCNSTPNYSLRFSAEL